MSRFESLRCRAQYVEQPAVIGTTTTAENMAAISENRQALAAAGALLLGAFVALSLLGLVHALVPARLDAALAKMFPEMDPVTLANFTA